MISAFQSFADMPADSSELHRWLISEGRLDLLRDRLTLSNIISRSVPLEEAEHGEMRASCPAIDHDDDQKSFFVNDRKGIFHCFGCGLHGDAIRWMTDYEGVDHVEAVRILAREAGLISTARGATRKAEED